MNIWWKTGGYTKLENVDIERKYTSNQINRKFCVK